MQASIMNGPSPNPDTLNMIRNPAAQPPADGQAAQAPANGSAQNVPQEGQQPLQQGAVQVPQQGTQVPQPTVPMPTVPLPGMEQLPGLETLPELPAMPAMPGLESLVQRLDGNFFAFLEKLADTPRFSEAMNQLLLNFTPASQGKPVPEELDALMRQLPQDETQAAAFLKQQAEGGTRFTGELFDLLRDAYAQATTKSAKTEILQFVRKFSDYTSSAHIEHSLVRTLEQLTKTLPREYTSELETMAQSLEQAMTGGDRGGALKLLQGKLLPYLTDISDRHPDMRLPNTLISSFKPLAARYENSSEEGLLQAFRQLAEQSALKPRMSKHGDFLKLIKDSAATQAKENRRFAEQLAKTADWAMKGKGGGEPRRIFRQMISNVLLNKSVYLPLEHAILPMEWNGKQLVSELWIDPDADREQRAQSGKERLIRFLLHMDIPNLGAVDLLLSSRGEEVDMQLSCPETVVPFSKMIQDEMTRILENNGLKPSGIQVRKWEKPLTLASAFPKIAKGDNGVNVKI